LLLTLSVNRGAVIGRISFTAMLSGERLAVRGQAASKVVYQIGGVRQL
jgi:hypothetical protein